MRKRSISEDQISLLCEGRDGGVTVRTYGAVIEGKCYRVTKRSNDRRVQMFSEGSMRKIPESQCPNTFLRAEELIRQKDGIECTASQ